jgi:DeoR family transcriptional regulator, aga operon transcriptional repressor
MLIERINANIAFIGCNGIEPEYGITNVNLPEAEIKRSMLHAAQQRVVVADGSKIGEVTLAYLCGVNEIDTLITGMSADPDIVARLRERKLDVMIAT